MGDSGILARGRAKEPQGLIHHAENKSEKLSGIVRNPLRGG